MVSDGESASEDGGASSDEIVDKYATREDIEHLLQEESNEREVLASNVLEHQHGVGIQLNEILSTLGQLSSQVNGAGAGAGGANAYGLGAADDGMGGGDRGGVGGDGGAAGPAFGSGGNHNEVHGFNRDNNSSRMVGQDAAAHLGPPPVVAGNPAVGFGAYGSAGSSEGPGARNQKMMEKMYLSARSSAWSSTLGRLFWCLSGSFAPPLNAAALPGLMNNSIEVAPVAGSLLSFSNFDIEKFTHRGASGAQLPLTVHLRLFAGAIVTLAQRGTPDNQMMAAACRDRVRVLGEKFTKATIALETHLRENYAAIQLAQNRGIILSLLQKDGEAYSTAMHLYADRYGRSFFPPAEVMTHPPWPEFRHLFSYLSTGGLIHAMVRDGARVGGSRTVGTRGGGSSGGGGSGARASAGTGAGASGRGKGVCRQFANKGSCRFGARCIFLHVASTKRKGDGGGDGGGGGKDGGGQSAAAQAAPASAAKKAKKNGGGASDGKGAGGDGAAKGDDE